MRFSFSQIQNSLPEFRIGPTKPRPRVTGAIRDHNIDAFMDQTQPTSVLQNELQQFKNLFIIIGGSNLHQERHRPGVVNTDMWTTDTFEMWPVKIVRVALLR
ncbi:hypothetical protein WICPIJ_007375 [Wickerhamomyces pijperi]|uniref:Uncharacterized protein n=1 Tax=Wickerhamomyces pijperi TaxID=599730 RepID=A0A9P8TK04_WICPI|nr:hypothetical protein WICPIJ_007375 [Wickerhamomyces pijperi]